MDYTGFTEFPFPAAALSQEDDQLQTFFYALPDEKQLELLNGCQSYDDFHARVEAAMHKV